MREMKVIIKTLADLSGVTKLGNALTRHSAAIRTVVAGYRHIKTVGVNAFRVVAREAATIAKGAAASAAGVAGLAREGMQFNVGLAQATNMFGGNRLSNFVRFRKELLNMQGDLGVARRELLGALYTAGSGQLPAEAALQAIRKAAQGVIADGADLNDVLGGVIAGYTAYGGNIDQIAESLYKIVQLGQTTFGEVGQYFGNVASYAKALGVPLDQLASMFATLTALKIPIAEASTGIRGMLTAITRELGDGWSKTHSFQGAVEEIAKKTNYSMVALNKTFGEHARFAASVVGENFGKATDHLQEFQGELTGLSEASSFADQFRGWTKIWQGIRAIVTDIGSQLEQKWAPTITRISEMVRSARDGGGFASMVDGITSTLESTVTWVVAQVQTAAELVQHLRSQDFGLVRMGVLAKSIAVEVVSAAFQVLLAQLTASVAIFIGLAKMMGAAFKRELLTMELPGMDRLLSKATEKALNSVTMRPDVAEKRWGAPEMSVGGMNPDAIKDWVKTLTPDQRADIATYDSRDAFANAVTKTASSIDAIKDSLADQFATSASNVKAAVSAATGGGFDWDAMFSANRAKVSAAIPTASSPAAAQSTGTPAARQVSALDRQLAEARERMAEMRSAASGSAYPDSTAVQTVLARQQAKVDQLARRASSTSSPPPVATTPAASVSQADAVAILDLLQTRLRAEQSDVSSARSSGGPGISKALTREQRDVSDVESAIVEVLDGNQETMRSIMAYMQRMQRDQKAMQAQIRSMPL